MRRERTEDTDRQKPFDSVKSPSMASRGPRIAIVVPLLLLLFATICGSSHGVPGSVSSSYKHRSLMPVQGRHANRIPNRIPNCNDFLLESQCLQSPKCRWCRSDALDDMCFAKVEAWRLPSQVFSCTN